MLLFLLVFYLSICGNCLGESPHPKSKAAYPLFLDLNGNGHTTVTVHSGFVQCIACALYDSNTIIHCPESSSIPSHFDFGRKIGFREHFGLTNGKESLITNAFGYRVSLSHKFYTFSGPAGATMEPSKGNQVDFCQVLEGKKLDNVPFFFPCSLTPSLCMAGLHAPPCVRVWGDKGVGCNQQGSCFCPSFSIFFNPKSSCTGHTAANSKDGVIGYTGGVPRTLHQAWKLHGRFNYAVYQSLPAPQKNRFCIVFFACSGS